jgi:hypothetical protein
VFNLLILELRLNLAVPTGVGRGRGGAGEEISERLEAGKGGRRGRGGNHIEKTKSRERVHLLTVPTSMLAMT